MSKSFNNSKSKRVADFISFWKKLFVLGSLYPSYKEGE